MSMTIQSSVKDKILATSSETSKVENVPAEMLRDLTNKWKREQMMVVLYGLNYIVSMSMKFATLPEKTDKVVLIKEKLKAARDRQKSHADNRRKPLEFEVGDRVMLKVSHWEGVIRFGKKGKLASSLHVSLDEIKVDKTLRFVEEPVENSDCEVMRFVLVVCETFVGIFWKAMQRFGAGVTFLPSVMRCDFAYFTGKILGGDQLLVILWDFVQESGLGFVFISMSISGSGVVRLPLWFDTFVDHWALTVLRELNGAKIERSG
ncbi:hypothetical protein Tco_1450033 [Tanacetum coccineum]